MAPKRQEHLSCHHLGDTTASTRLQQDIKKMPSLPPRKSSYYHQAVTKHSATQKNQKFYPDANMRTNIFSHTSFHTHNPSNNSTSFTKKMIPHDT